MDLFDEGPPGVGGGKVILFGEWRANWKWGASWRGEGGGKWNSLRLSLADGDARYWCVAEWSSSPLSLRPSNARKEAFRAKVGSAGVPLFSLGGGGGKIVGCKCFCLGSEVIASWSSSLNSLSLSGSPCASSLIMAEFLFDAIPATKPSNLSWKMLLIGLGALSL